MVLYLLKYGKRRIEIDTDMPAIVKKLWFKFKYSNYLEKLLYINILIFVLVSLSRLIIFLLHLKNQGLYYLLNYLMLPANIDHLLHKPWTIITYMFTHESFIHILFNMLWFYGFGKIFIEFLTSKQLLSTYIMGGIVGGLFYILAFNIFPVFETLANNSYALGASAAVIAVVIAISFYVPDYKVNLLFFGLVKVKHIAIATIIIDFLSVASENSGGHIAHLGGALYGIGYAWLLRKPKIKINFRKTVKQDTRRMTDYEYNYQKKKEQKEIDRILDKIARHGYDSLTKKEKETLFKAGKK